MQAEFSQARKMALSYKKHEFRLYLSECWQRIITAMRASEIRVSFQFLKGSLHPNRGAEVIFLPVGTCHPESYAVIRQRKGKGSVLVLFLKRVDLHQWHGAKSDAFLFMLSECTLSNSLFCQTARFFTHRCYHFVINYKECSLL